MVYTIVAAIDAVTRNTKRCRLFFFFFTHKAEEWTTDKYSLWAKQRKTIARNRGKFGYIPIPIYFIHKIQTVWEITQRILYYGWSLYFCYCCWYCCYCCSSNFPVTHVLLFILYAKWCVPKMLLIIIFIYSYYI